MCVWRSMVASLLLVASISVAIPAVAAESQGRTPQREQHLDRYELLPEEIARIQETRAYETMSIMAFAGGAAVVAGIATGSPVAALAVAGAIVAGYVSLP